MNVSLTSELETFVQAKVDSKMYQTASEVVREALRLLKRHDEEEKSRLEALRNDVRHAIDASKRGEGRLITDNKAFLEEIKAKGRKRLAARKAGK